MITFEAPYPDTEVILVLPEPNLGNAKATTSNVRTKTMMDGTIETFIQKRTLNTYRLTVTIPKLKAIEVLEFMQFYIGSKVRYKTSELTVIGYFTKNPVELEMQRRAVSQGSQEDVDLELTLEGSMKTMTSGALSEIAKTTGTESVILVEIAWTTGKKTYSSHNIYGYKSKLLRIGNLETVLTVDNKSSQDVSLTFDDIDGEIKTVTDTVDVHKTPCTIKQCYTSLPESDAFILFQGQISAPFNWGEGDRTVQFNVLSEIESFEVGFSPEEGQLSFVPLDLLGQPWPLVFGSVLNCPAQKVQQTLTGVLLEDIGIVDPVLDVKIQQLMFQYNDNAVVLSFNQLIMESANNNTPVAQLLPQYIALINTAHDNIKELNDTITALDKARAAEKKKPSIVALRNTRIALEEQLDSNSHTLVNVESNKAQTEGYIDLSLYDYEVKKQAALSQIEAYNALCNIMKQVILINQEKCRQQKLVKTSFQVQDGNLFPQGEIVEISLKGVKYRGTFTDTRFDVAVGPYAKYGTIPIAPWTVDTDPCEPADENNGVATFYLENDPPENLVGLYLWIQSRDGTRHIIKCVRQYQQKVIFELVNSNIADGNPSGISINQLLGKIQDIFSISQGNDLLSSDGRIGKQISIDDQLYDRPEVQQLFQILAQIAQYSISKNLSIQPNFTDEEARDVLQLFFGPDWPTLHFLDGLTTAQIQSWFKQYYITNLREIEYLSKALFTLPMDQLSNAVLVDVPNARRVFTIIGEDVSSILEACAVPLPHWFDNNQIRYEEWPDTLAWTAESGSMIRVRNDDCQIYVANILPSTIHSVHAYRTTIQGQRILAPVPSSYYTKNENVNLGTINITVLIFPKALREIEGENWEDDVYVTMSSSVGPHICDVLDYLITTYIPNGTTDFSDVRTALDNYPVNFALFDRPNVLQEIARIAWESRCALVRTGTNFKLKYLSTPPTADKTFTLADIETESFKISHTPTENLTTRMIATYSQNYLPLLPHKHLPRYVLRNNVKKYALHDQEEYFHTFNVPSLVLKSATFWLIRNSNTWKHVTFTTTPKNIQLDVLDTILFTDILSIRGVIEEASYDFETKTITISAWLPIRSGETDEYIFAWPSDKTTEFPLPIEIQQGLAGGYGPGSGVTGTIPGC